MLTLGALGIRGKNTFYVGPSHKKAFDIASLFENGEQGLWLDPSDLSTMFHDAVGTNHVTGTDQPVGLFLDKSKGLVLGAQLLSNGDFTKGLEGHYGIGGTNTLVDGKLQFTSTPNTANSRTEVRFSGLDIGRWYEVIIEAKSITPPTGDSIIRTFTGFSPSITNFHVLTNETKTFKFLMLASGTEGILRVYASSAGVDSSPVTIEVSKYSVRELLGNHAYQSSSAVRPISRQKPILESELLPTYDFRTWTSVSSPDPLTANSFTTTSSGGVRNNILKPNTKYLVELAIENTGNINVYHGSSAHTSLLAGARRKVQFVATTDDGTVFYIRNSVAGVTTLHSIKIQEITGYRTDQSYIEYDTVEDKLITTLSMELTGCTVIRSVPSVGTQILTNQTIPATYADNQNHCGLIVINRALTPSETSAIAAEFNKRAGV